MVGSFVVAQGTTPASASNPTPLRIITLAKPTTGHAEIIDLGYDQKVKVDFSGISNEKITLVHVGEKLIVLYDNQATQTIQPFFDSMNVPLPGITVEIEPGRDVPSSEFATLFPISTDQSILPAAGDAGGPTSAASFSDSSVDPLSAWGPLALLGPESLPDFVVTQRPTTLPTAGPSSPSVQFTSGTAAPTVQEAALDTVQDGLDLAAGLTIGSLGLAGTVETAQSSPLTFTAGTEAINVIAFGTNFAAIVVSGADPSATFSWEIVARTLIGHVGSLSGPVGIELAIGGTTTASSFGSATPTITVTLTDGFPHLPGSGANTITVTGVEIVATDTGGDSVSGPLSVAIVDDTSSIVAMQDALMPYINGTGVHGTWQPEYGADGPSVTAAVGIAVAAGSYSGLTYTITDTGTDVSGHDVFKVTVTGGAKDYAFYEYSDYNATTQQAEMFAFTDLAHTTAFFEIFANTNGAYDFHIDTNSLHYASETSFSGLIGSTGNGNFLEVNSSNIGTFQNDPVAAPSGTHPLIIDGFSMADANPTHHNVFKDANGIGVDGGSLDTDETLTFRFLAAQSQVNFDIGKSGSDTFEHFQVTIWDSTHTMSRTEDIILPAGQTLTIDAANWAGTGGNTFFNFYAVDITNIATAAGEDAHVVVQSVQYDAMTTIAVANTALNFALSVTDGDGDVYTTSDNLTVSLFGTHEGSGYQLPGTATAEVFAASAGRDTIIGGTGGGDTVDYSNSGKGVTVNLSGESDTTAAGVGGAATGDVILGIENLVGSNFADSLTAHSGGSLLTGLGDADSLNGGNGADTFRYLATSDSSVAAHDTIANFTHGSDLIDFSAIDGITQDASYLSSAPATVAAHSVVFYQDGADTVVLANASNAVENFIGADMMLVLTGINANTLASGDFQYS